MINREVCEVTTILIYVTRCGHDLKTAPTNKVNRVFNFQAYDREENQMFKANPKRVIITKVNKASKDIPKEEDRKVVCLR